MIAFDQAIYSALTANAALGTLLSSGSAVYLHAAPAGAADPFVVFGKQANTPIHDFAGVALENALYRVVGVCDERYSPMHAGSIAAAIDTALVDQNLSVSGFTLTYLRRDSDVDYAEVTDGRRWHHRGALYRLMADPT